uniref:Uncharacterized protein n=1 Tax=Setaria digitata TaxID=48799 RepID=A0A915Q0K6_9BILA
MDNDDQIMHPNDAELLASEEEFGHSSEPQPSTSFFINSSLSSYQFNHNNNFSMQQFLSSQTLPQSTIESALHCLAEPLIQLIATDELPNINSRLITSDYSNSAIFSSMQSSFLSAAAQSSTELLNSLAWDQWLCALATSLSSAEWQFYWMNYLSLYGTTGLPQHLVNFFAAVTSESRPEAILQTIIPDVTPETTATPGNFNFSSSSNLTAIHARSNSIDHRQQFYGM